MWHLMWLTTLCFVCYLSAINCVAAAPIDSADEAARYLERFGYLERGPQDSSYSQSVKAESFIDAIKDFQSFAGLNKTGELDKETLELMNKPRCGVPDRIRPGHSSTRQKRFVIQGSHWPKKQLTYKIKKYTEDMPKSDVDREITRAFQMWADVADLTFVHVDNELADVDINIIFASGEHDDGNCNDTFNDGPGGILAHAAFPSTGGYVHFDESETWTLNSDKGTNLFQVATHEFGHALGLRHSHVKTAVMYYKYEYYHPDFKLDKDDIQGIQTLYGENQLRKLEIELKALRTTVEHLNNKLEGTQIATQMELKKMRDNVVDDLSAILYELAERNFTAGNFSFSELLSQFLKTRTSPVVDTGKMPSSCEDLHQMGQKVNGFFTVQGAKKMELISCNFNANQNDIQKWIGYADVKSAPVHFHVQRNSSFSRGNTPIPFDSTVVNEGNAMDLTSGIFTAPRPGIYFFSFAGTARLYSSSSSSWFVCRLVLNGNLIGSSHVEEKTNPVDQWSPVTLQSTLNLKKGDRVWVTISGGRAYLYDDNDRLTHFTGFMLEKDILASL